MSKLKLKDQLCFPFYIVSKEIIRKYKPLLDKIDLTYTQYITMMYLWENSETNVKDLGEKLFLDSGTLTPLLKKLEKKGYIIREHEENDARNLKISLTKTGKDLENAAIKVHDNMCKYINISNEEYIVLKKVITKILDNLKED
jgi:transcriptional regulator, MarR family